MRDLDENGAEQAGGDRPVVSGGDPSPILQATEHYLDPVSSFVAALVVFDGLVARLSAWDAGRYSLIYKGLTEPIRVIPPVSQQPVGVWEAIHKSSGASVITELASGHEEPDRPSNPIGDGMQLRVHAAFCPPDQTSTPPFLTAGSMPCGVL